MDIYFIKIKIDNCKEFMIKIVINKKRNKLIKKKKINLEINKKRN